jgi:folate-binding Fe-S cluster repair protein YgfZ
VSFTKGCYPGQELVERMDSRGAGAPVQLRIVSRDGLAPGARIEIDGRDVGTVTSVGRERAIVRAARNADIGEPIEPS